MVGKPIHPLGDVLVGRNLVVDKKPIGTWWLRLVYLVLLIGSVVLTLWGLRNAPNSAIAAAIVPAGIVAFFLAASFFPLAILLLDYNKNLRADLSALTERFSELLGQIHEHTLLSDSAKRIAYRREERQMLRKAIEEDISHEDWDAAIVLVNTMADQFGYIEEAEEYRRHIDERRADVMYRRMRKAVEHCEALYSTREWTAAYAEAARIKRMFPEMPQVQDLEDRVRQAWHDHKQALEQQFLDAAGQSDAEEALEILKELDSYLSPREAEPYKEIARGVIGKARDNLGIQFKLAARDQDWERAVQVGERIMEAFPNSLMAREVRERIGVLRVRATESGQIQRGASPAAALAAAHATRPVEPTNPS